MMLCRGGVGLRCEGSYLSAHVLLVCQTLGGSRMCDEGTVVMKRGLGVHAVA
jgi:hypothetical protein